MTTPAPRPNALRPQATPRERAAELRKRGLDFAAVQAAETRPAGWETQARDYEICRRVRWVRAVHRAALRRGSFRAERWRGGQCFVVQADVIPETATEAASVEITVYIQEGIIGHPEGALGSLESKDGIVFMATLPVVGFPDEPFLHVPPKAIPRAFPGADERPAAVLSPGDARGVLGLSEVAGWAVHLESSDTKIRAEHKRKVKRGRPSAASNHLSQARFLEAVQAARSAKRIEPRDGRGRGPGRPADAELTALVGLVLIDELGMTVEAANEVHPNGFSDWHDLARSVGNFRRRIEALNKWLFYPPKT